MYQLSKEIIPLSILFEHWWTSPESNIMISEILNSRTTLFAYLVSLGYLRNSYITVVLEFIHATQKIKGLSVNTYNVDL